MIPERFAEFVARLRRGSGERDRARLAAVLELNRALAKAPDRRTLLELLLDEAVRLFAAERGFVLLAPDAGTERLRVAAARTLDRESVQHAEKKVSSTVVDRCLRDGRAVLSEDAQAGDLAASRSVADLKLRSVLAVPLRAAELTLGCLYLDHRFHAGVFGVDDLPWLEAFADQAAIALHLHALLEQVRAHSRRVESDNLRLAAEVAAQTERVTRLQAELTRGGLRHAYDEILGDSPAVLRLLHLLDRVVDGEYPVLLVGESGTGKELVARAVWRHGRRAAGPWVAVNVAAIQPELLESELFGHVRGAFTGADRARDGLVRRAEGGGLFLDEVTEMPLELQAKLLRFLEERAVRPVGGDLVVPVDLRVVAATNRDPRRAVQDGKLREDLYWRLAVVTVPLPPLRDRREDLPLLTERFLAEAAAARGAPARRATPALFDALARRSWPGNVRELRNAVYRLDALAQDAELGPELLEPEALVASANLPTLDLAQLEQLALREALRVADGNKAEAARLLGISRRSLYDRMGRSD
ncbi:MAG: sigma 54-interacting transcriptional regulator [Planctomycetes bacterium]|nr:sigma 54-interacting transcriptional regulator [Planctomycetota bacterium]